MPRFRFFLNCVDEKFGRNNDRREEPGSRVEQPQACLLADVGDVPEIPRHQIVDLVKRGERDVNSVGEIFPVKNAAFDVAFCEYRHLFGYVELLKRAHEVQITRPVRLRDPLEFAFDQYRAKHAIF